MQITIISGLSGAGKSVALHTLEDEGYYCIDNLPTSLLTQLARNISEYPERPYQKIAIGIDARSVPSTISGFPDLLDDLRSYPSFEVDVLFLETSKPELVRRFSETRRKHPLTQSEVPLETAIEQEIELLAPIKATADSIIDTSTLNLHQLREIIKQQVSGGNESTPAMTFQSFGFKHGVPSSTDFVFDVRCLPNPYWNPALRHHTGRDEPVIEFLRQHDTVTEMFDDLRDFLIAWLPRFRTENRAYLTVSIGCTGGRHRSVYLAEQLAAHFKRETETVSVRHRELD